MSKRSRQHKQLTKLLAKKYNGTATLQDLNMIDRMLELVNKDRVESGLSPYRPESSGTSYSKQLPSKFADMKVGEVKDGWEKLAGGAWKMHPVKSDNGAAARTWADTLRGKNKSSNPYVFHTHADKDEEVFTCPSSEIQGECPIAKIPDILISKRAWETWITLAGEIDTEWIAYLIGHMDKNAEGEPRCVIEHYYFPPQTATGTSVDVPTGVVPRAGVIGAVHSHVKMGTFFSSTDKEHSNWPVEIVINDKGSYEALIRHELKCGSWAKNKAKVFVSGSAVSEQVNKALTAAFANGKLLAKGKRAKEDESPMEPASETKAEVVDSPAGQTSQLTLYDGGRVAIAETGADDGSAIAEESDCAGCQGMGLVEIMVDGQPVNDICPGCNGWGKLLDGKPIAAGEPEVMQ